VFIFHVSCVVRFVVEITFFLISIWFLFRIVWPGLFVDIIHSDWLFSTGTAGREPEYLQHWVTEGWWLSFARSLARSLSSIQHKHNLLHPSFSSTPPSLSHSHKHTHTCARVGSLHFPGSSSQYGRSRARTQDLHCPPRELKFNDVLHYLTSASASLPGCAPLLASVSLALLCAGIKMDIYYGIHLPFTCFSITAAYHHPCSGAQQKVGLFWFRAELWI